MSTVDEIETILLNEAEKNEYLNYIITRQKAGLDDLMEVMVGTDSNSTGYDLIDRALDENYEEHYYSLDEWEKFILVTVAKNRINLEELRNSGRNLLNEENLVHWEERYRNALARFIIANGQPLRWADNYYGGGHDYQMTKKYNGNLPVAVVTGIQEDKWDEFEGTFNTASQHHGYSAQAILEDGTHVLIRYEGTLDEIMRKLLGGL